MPGRGRPGSTSPSARSGRQSRALAGPCAATFVTALHLACGATWQRPAPQVRVIDLLARFDQVEKRPEAGSFSIAQHTLGGHTRATLIVPSSSRLIWRTRLPRRATLRVHVALPASPASTVRFRMGVSDHRVYDKLVERIVSSGSQQGWVPLEADLRRYAGLQLSIFYRPEGREWRLVLSTDHLEGSPAVAFWAEPRVETDTEAAGRFFRAHTKGPARGDS